MRATPYSGEWFITFVRPLRRPPAEAADRANALARELAKGSPSAIASGMQYFHLSRGRTSQEAGELAKKLRADLMQSADFKEGYEAFKHKREPHWPSMPHNSSADGSKVHSQPQTKRDENARE